ncbi:MAG: MG2 domain-containing protein, partial [Planctomycetales bacterium]
MSHRPTNHDRLGRGKAWLVFAALIAVGFAAWVFPPVRESSSAPRSDSRVTSIYSRKEPAKNPVTLSLFVDDQKVLGWISGIKDRAGNKVTVTWTDPAPAGPAKKQDKAAADANSRKQTRTAVVRDDNSFVWTREVVKPVEVTFSVAGMTRVVKLAPPEQAKPTVFFVVDRTVYRPQQTMRFAGFLRTLNARGEFAPLANREVEIRLTSKGKKTVAAKMKRVSDAFGRVTGEYPFHAEDALDNYELSIPDFKGSAELKLAEFRKAKVKLTIDGEMKEKTLKVTFQALDFLDKPVPGSKLRYTAQVVRNGGNKVAYPLKAKEFAYYEA